MKITKLIFLLFLLISFGTNAQKKPLLHVSKVFHINSGGGYDYLTVDTASDRLYVSHGTKVNVINKITGDSIVFKETFHDKLGKQLTRDVTKTISRPVA